jgi:hypothetical protein
VESTPIQPGNSLHCEKNFNAKLGGFMVFRASEPTIQPDTTVRIVRVVASNSVAKTQALDGPPRDRFPTPLPILKISRG